MLKKVVGATLMAGLSACSDTANPLPVDSGTDSPVVLASIESVRFTARYNMCVGWCVNTWVIRPDGALARFGTYGGDAGAPAVEQAIDVETGVRAKILAAAAQALTTTWEERYGCPDCVDQGAFEVEITSDGSTRKTVLDPFQHPTAFDPLLEAIQPVRKAHEMPASVCAAPQTCTPGKVSLLLTLDAAEGLKPTWYNDSDQTIFLAGCTTVQFQREADGWSGPAAVCAWEGTARQVLPHTVFGDMALSITGKPGIYTASGSYGDGCTRGQPLSKAACGFSATVTSNKVTVTN